MNAALQNWNVNLPTGQLFGPDETFNIQASGQLMNADAFRPLVVAYRNGAPVRLSQVANVVNSVEDNKNASWLYSANRSQRSISLSVMRQPGSNTIEVTDAIRGLLPRFRAELPPSVHLAVRGDRSRNIREAFTDIQVTMVATLVLVVAVIFLFLHNGSATLIPALALPFSILGTFAVMQVMGFTPRQSLDDGADPVDWFRRRRRDRDAREHRPAHGARRDSACGIAEGIEGNRLHDRLDDRVACRRVHSRSCS